MSLDLGRRLLDSGVVHPGELRRAVFKAITRGRPLARTLADCSAAARAYFERAIEEEGRPVIRTVVPQAELLEGLPPGLPDRLLAIPIRKDARTGTVDVAVVDPGDAHVVSEIAHHLRAPVRAVAAPLAEIERALLLVPRAKVSTAEYPSAETIGAVEPKPSAAPATVPTAGVPRPPSTPPGAPEDAVPLVRRARTSLAGPPSIPIQSARRIETPRPIAAVKPPVEANDPHEEGAAMPLSRRRVQAPPPPSTNPFERRAEPVHVVVDFGPAAREERKAIAERTQRRESDAKEAVVRGAIELKRPPFPSLTRVLEAIDVASDRDALVSGLLRGLATTAHAAALFAPRRGKFAGIGAIGELDVERLKNAVCTPKGIIADALARGERIGLLDAALDRELHHALALERFAAVHVLVHPAFVADKPALLLVSYGMGDVIESSRRARVLATAAAAALDRMLRR